MELAIDVIERARCGLVAHRGADRLAADDAFHFIQLFDIRLDNGPEVGETAFVSQQIALWARVVKARGITTE